MKNINKLSFSMLALVAALASTDAMAGSYNPTCDGNVFNIGYKCYRGGVDTGISLVGGTATYGGQYEFPSSASDNCPNPGYTFSGWAKVGTDGAIPLQPNYTPGQTVTIGTETSEIFGDGTGASAIITFATMWSAMTGEVTLNQSGGTGGTSKLYAVGSNLAMDEDGTRLVAASTTNGQAITLPERTGYTFAGYSKKSNISDPGTEWKLCADRFAELSVGYDVNDSYFDSCPLIDSDGKVVAQGIWAPVTNNSLTLYAAWQSYTYYVEYNKGTGPISVTGIPEDRTLCSHGKLCEAGKDNVTPSSSNYNFLNWKISIGGQDVGTIEDEGSMVPMLDDMVENKGLTNGGTITLTAQWAPKSMTVNFYAKYPIDGQDPIETIQYTSVDGLDGPGTVTLPTFAEHSFRGYAYPVTETNAFKENNVVDQDALYLPGNTFGSEENTILIADKDGNVYDTTNWRTIFNDKVNSGITGINVFGVWAKDCVAEITTKNVAACKLYIDGTGKVHYLNTCDTGYHISGESNDDKSTGEPDTSTFGDPVTGWGTN